MCNAFSSVVEISCPYVESQKSYRPGYPIEKRGIYYLARSLSSQLSLVTENTDYGSLEKCYSIWICRDDIPIDDKYSISFYEVSNTKNIGGTAMEKGKYDLMTLAVIKLGDTVYNGEKGDEGFELLHFLNTIMYPHREDFIEELSDYIDFSENEELWKEKPCMFSLSQCIYEDGLKEGREQGIASLVLDHIEEHMPKEKSIQKLQKFFSLTEEKAEEYYERFAEEV